MQAPEWISAWPSKHRHTGATYHHIPSVDIVVFTSREDILARVREGNGCDASENISITVSVQRTEGAQIEEAA